jgi:hypothetical protein
VKRRSRAGGKPVKTRRRKAATPKRRNAPKSVRSRSPFIADLQEQLDRRTRERDEALEQQAATSEVLQVISSSAGDLEPVFATLLQNAVRICDATFGDIHRWDGEELRIVASHNTPPAFAELRKRSPLRPDPKTNIGHMLATKTVVHVADFAAEPAYTERREPGIVAAVELGGVRTILAVPMLKENELIGAFILARHEVRPFTDKQIELVRNFAAQAVIAIENTRLLKELRQRTADLTESLEQQTATSEVLRVISSSPGELEPVFEAMLQNAVRICGAKFGNLFVYEGEFFRIGATHGAPHAYVEYLRREGPFRADPRLGLGRLAQTKQSYQVADIAAQPTHNDKLRVASGRVKGPFQLSLRTNIPDQPRCSSNLERLMTPRTSAVAVCCSSDSVSSRVRCCSASNSRCSTQSLNPGAASCCGWRQPSWRAPEPCWACRCSKMAKWSAPSSSTAGKCSRSPTSRWRWSRTSLPKPSSPLKIHDC